MYSKIYILNSIPAEKLRALTLENAAKGVKQQVLEQVKLIDKGVTRMSFYASCFTDNYQDVCTQLKKEDVRFWEGLVQLVKHRDIIAKMVQIYIECMLKNVDSKRIKKIQKELVRLSVIISMSSLTTQSFSAAVTMAVCQGFSIKYAIDSKLNKVALIGTTLAIYYARVQQAADAARALQSRNAIYYRALYHVKLEMLYFLIAPVISRNDHINISLLTDQDIVHAIERLIR